MAGLLGRMLLGAAGGAGNALTGLAEISLKERAEAAKAKAAADRERSLLDYRQQLDMSTLEKQQGFTAEQNEAARKAQAERDAANVQRSAEEKERDRKAQAERDAANDASAERRHKESVGASAKDNWTVVDTRPDGSRLMRSNRGEEKWEAAPKSDKLTARDITAALQNPYLDQGTVKSLEQILQQKIKDENAAAPHTKSSADIEAAKAAVAGGKSRTAVRDRLKSAGYTDEELTKAGL